MAARRFLSRRVVALAHAVIVIVVWVGAVLIAYDAVQAPAPDDPNADWHWLDMQISLGFALLVVGYAVMHGVYAWVALTRNNPLLLMASDATLAARS